MISEVGVVKCRDYDYELVYRSVKRSIELAGGLKGRVKKGDSVLLKVNLIGAFKPERAATTHPSVVRAVCEIIGEIGGNPIVADSSGAISDVEEAFRLSGIEEAAKKAGVKVVNLQKYGYKKVKVAKGKQLKEMYFSKKVLESDLVISLPKLKTHVLALYTGSIKNFFGCIPRKERKLSHRLAKLEPFSQSIVDIFSLSSCDFSIMDGVVGMEGNGPTHGKPRKLGAIISGNDCVAVDAVSADLIGFKALDIPHIRQAAEQGLGICNMDNIAIKGDYIEKINFRKGSMVKGMAGRLPPKMIDIIQDIIMAKPYLESKKCTKCGFCMKSCPADAISMAPYPIIDRDKCILCYCCHENCPTGAMDLRKPYIGEMVSWVRDRIGV